MSLIPSESYSFPDNYSPVARCWKKPGRKTTSPPQIAPMQRQAMARAAKENGSVISLPEPDRADVFTEPIAETLEAVQAPIAEDEMNGVSVSSPNSAEISFLAALQKMAEQTSSVAPSQEIERVIPPPPTAEINGDSAPPEEEMFLKALAKMVEPKNAPPPPRPALDDTPPPMPADDDAPPSLPPGFKILPRRPRPLAPVSPADVDEKFLQTANGHGRARQFRPKTPIRKAKPALKPAIKIDNGDAKPPTKPALKPLAMIDNGSAKPSPKPVPNTAKTNGAPAPKNPRPALPRPATLGEDFDFSEPPIGLNSFLKEQRRSKLIRLIVIELFAMALLVPPVWLVLGRHVSDPTIILLLNTLAIAAAAGAVIAPIMLFAFGPALTRRR